MIVVLSLLTMQFLQKKYKKDCLHASIFFSANDQNIIKIYKIN